MVSVRNPIIEINTRPGMQARRDLVQPTKVIFYTVFVLVFLLSGAITMSRVIPYRMGLVSFLVLPLFLIHRVKVDKVLISYALLAFVILASAIVNNSNFNDLLLFFRTLIFSYLIYFLVNVYINENNIVKIVRLCVLIGVIQLPFVLLQQLSYDHLPARLVVGVSKLDFDFGTFNFKGDSKMGFFLILLIIFILFDRHRSHFIKYRWFLVSWFTLTILVANSEVTKIIVVITWVVFFLTHLKKKAVYYLVFSAVIVLLSLSATGMLDDVWAKLGRSFERNVSMDPVLEENYLSGKYARGAAIAYFLDQDIKWLGDGPSKYYDVLNRTRERGNTGHIFTFYSEVGLLGWLISTIIFFLIAFPIKNGKIRLSWVGVLMFLSVQILSFTTEIMNDISVFFIYSIIGKTYLMAGNNKRVLLQRSPNTEDT